MELPNDEEHNRYIDRLILLARSKIIQDGTGNELHGGKVCLWKKIEERAWKDISLPELCETWIRQQDPRLQGGMVFRALRERAVLPNKIRGYSGIGQASVTEYIDASHPAKDRLSVPYHIVEGWESGRIPIQLSDYHFGRLRLLFGFSDEEGKFLREAIEISNKAIMDNMSLEKHVPVRNAPGQKAHERKIRRDQSKNL